MLRLAANHLRFQIYERYGNSVADAKPYSLTAPNPAKIASYRERLGFNMGGPFRIPKVYDGRDKTFFFFNYEGGRSRDPMDSFSTVPLPGERNGDFTARGVQLFNPATQAPLGSVIPPGMLDKSAQGLLQFIPMPNLPGTVQNYHLQARVPDRSDRFSVRVLHALTPKANLVASYNLNSNRPETLVNFPSFLSKQSVLGQFLTLGVTQNPNAHLIIDSRILFSRYRSQTLNRFAFTQDIAAQLGITGVSNDPINFGVPQISFTNFTGLNDPVPALRRNQTILFIQNVSRMFNKHTLHVGGEVGRGQNNNRVDPTARGSFTFTGLLTSQLDAQGHPLTGTGFDFADFLLGLPEATTVRFGSSSSYFRSWGFNAFVSDDWRIHPRFTLTLGLRYEVATPPIELFDHIANLDLNSSITAVATVVPGQVGPFSGPLPRSLIRGDYNNFAPRLAFAWRPKVKRTTTVRGGYSIFYNLSIYNQLDAQLANQPPFAQAQTLLTSTSQVLTLANGFPAQPPGTVLNTVGVDPNYRVGYTQVWNLAVETEPVTNLVFEITYTGTKGTHLDLLRAPNRALPGGPLGTELMRRIPNAPGFTYDTFGGSSIYHALQVRVQKRMTHGLQLQGTYTFGKSIDNASSIGGGAAVVVQDDNNFDAERGLSSFDVRHQLRLSYTFSLPFGPRSRWATHGWQATALGNWTLSGNTTVLSGSPFSARLGASASNNSGTGANFSERPDQVGDPNLPASQRTPLHFFNTAAFTSPAPGLFGDAARNTITGPGTVQFNFAVAKSFPFGVEGSRRLEIRAEAQNLLNTPNFAGLNTVLGSTTFGRVQGSKAMRTIDLAIRWRF